MKRIIFLFSILFFVSCTASHYVQNEINHEIGNNTEFDSTVVYWGNESQFLNTSFCNYLMNNEYINGLLISNESNAEKFYSAYKDKFPNSILNNCTGHWRDFINKHTELNTYYLGEPKATELWYDVQAPEQILTFGDSLLVDEPDVDLLDEYSNNSFHVTYSNYRNYLKIFGNRINIPGTDQIWAWKYLDAKFRNRFDHIWIHITLNEDDFQLLIDEIKSLNRNRKFKVMLYGGDDDITPQQAIESLNLFFNLWSKK